MARAGPDNGVVVVVEVIVVVKVVVVVGSSRHPSVTNDNGLASPFDKGVFLLKEMRPDKIIRK